MPRRLWIIPTAIAMLGILVIAWIWLASEPPAPIDKRVPETLAVNSGLPVSGAGAQEDSVVEAASQLPRLVTFDVTPPSLPGSWPRFRGEHFDGIGHQETSLATEWGEGEPKKLWEIPVGEGYAGPVIWNARVYLMDYDGEQKANVVRCLALADGRDVWRYIYPFRIKRNHGISRTVPAVNERYVVGIGPKGNVFCLDPIRGTLHWQMDLVERFHARIPEWYTGQCPLIDGDRVILAPGGDALLIAVDGESGELIWQTPNPHGWDMSYSSIVPVEFDGGRMYIYCATGGVVGVSAEDGGILWETDAWRVPVANIPTPVPVGEGRIFLSGGYRSGSMMLQLKKNVDGQDPPYLAEPIFRLEDRVFGAPQHTPILFEGYLYGIRSDGQLVCLDLEGALKWTSGPAHRFGLGPLMIADGMIYVMNDTGTLSLVRASPEGYRLLAQSQIWQEAHDSWGPMAIAGGRLLVRDLTRMACLDVREARLSSTGL